MVSYMRLVAGAMNKQLYKKLGDVPNIDRGWSLIREDVGLQLFGDDYATVPILSSAVYFNQMFLFIKKSKLLETLRIRPPTYKVIGNLDYLVDQSRSTWIPTFNLAGWDIADRQHFTSHFRYRQNSNEDDSRVEKMVELLIKKLHARSIDPPPQETLVLNTTLLPELRGVNTVYVVTDVVFASYVHFVIRIGEKESFLTYDHDIPMGFKYRKYKMTPDGTVIGEIPTVLKMNNQECIWLRPEPQPFPRTSGMMRRSTAGLAGDAQRPTRYPKNNLTVLTPPTTVSDRRRRIYTNIRMHQRHTDPSRNPLSPSVDELDRLRNARGFRSFEVVDPPLSNREQSWRNGIPPLSVVLEDAVDYSQRAADGNAPADSMRFRTVSGV